MRSTTCYYPDSEGQWMLSAAAWWCGNSNSGTGHFHDVRWYYLVLSVASAVTTFMFVVGSRLAVWRGSHSVRRACAWLAITAVIVNLHWYVLGCWVSRADLSVGYFLWWLSLGLLA